ncbi:MAG: hypothetical protein AB1505_28350 [Candidatus Latescibacterota bacterium]
MRASCAAGVRLLLVALLLLAAGAGDASQEVEVSLDAEGAVLRLDRRLAGALGLFPEYAAFREARLFALPDSAFALEIYHQEGGRLVKERRLLDGGEAAALRRQVSERVAAVHPVALQDRDGRTRFLARTFLLAYGHYSWAVPLAAGLDGRPAQVTGLLTGSAGFAVPFLLTRHCALGHTVASLAAHGGTTGIAHGVLLGQVLLGGGEQVRARAGLTVATSLAGFAGGYAAGQRLPMPPGAADVVGWGGNYGLLLALGAVHVAGLLDDDHVRPAGFAGLAGSGLGYWGGWRLGRAGRISRGDADLLALHTALGAGLAAALVHLVDPDVERAVTGAAMVGSGVGLAAGHRLVAGRDYSPSQTWMALLGALGGGLFGAAVNLVAEGDERLGPALVSAGALAGGWATSLALAGEAAGEGEAAGWGLQLQPALRLGRVPGLTLGLRLP